MRLLKKFPGRLKNEVTVVGGDTKIGEGGHGGQTTIFCDEIVVRPLLVQQFSGRTTSLSRCISRLTTLVYDSLNTHSILQLSR